MVALGAKFSLSSIRHFENGSSFSFDYLPPFQKNDEKNYNNDVTTVYILL